jgi:hypothetical protein
VQEGGCQHALLELLQPDLKHRHDTLPRRSPPDWQRGDISVAGYGRVNEIGRGAAPGEPCRKRDRKLEPFSPGLLVAQSRLNCSHLQKLMMQRTKNVPFRHPLLKLQAVPRGGLFLCARSAREEFLTAALH